MQNEIDVTVIIPAYEASGFIATAIGACLAQQDITLEVIVVDDGSMESSEAAVAETSGGDPRVRFIQLPQNGGPSAARNAALDVARGRYVAVLDADDSMVSDRLGQMVRAAEEANADIIVDHVMRWHFEDPSKPESLLLSKGMADVPLEIDLLTYTDPASDDRFGAALGYLKPLFRRAFIEAHGLRYDLSLRNSEDYYFVADMLAFGARMLLIPFAGYRYAIRENSISYRIKPEHAFAIVEAERRFRDRYADRLPAGVAAMSARRIARFQRMGEFEKLAEAIKRKDWGAAVSAATETPGNTLAHLTRLSGVMLAKFG